VAGASGARIAAGVSEDPRYRTARARTST